MAKFLRITKFPNSPRGAALLIFLIILLLGMASLWLSQLNRAELGGEEQAQTLQALAQAKEALLGFAASYYDRKDNGNDQAGRYGFLPCPDKDTGGGVEEGVSHGNDCGVRYASVLGRLPWRSLGLPPLRDGAGECLWYAVSGEYKSASTGRSELLNEDTPGRFRVFRGDTQSSSEMTTSLSPNPVEGSPKDRAVAVIIAPGRRIGSQARNGVVGGGTEICGGNYSYDNYLDVIPTSFFSGSENVSLFSPLNFVAAANNVSSNTVNDRIAYITREELWQTVYRRTEFHPPPTLPNVPPLPSVMECFTDMIGFCLAEFAGKNSNRLPWAWWWDPKKNPLDPIPNDSYTESNKHRIGLLPNLLTPSKSISLIGSCDPITQISKLPEPKEPQLTYCTQNIIKTKETFQKLWENWKDHVFYAVSDAFSGSSPASCATKNCIQLALESLPTKESCAAVVIFAGSPLKKPIQETPTQAPEIRDKQQRPQVLNYKDYLEGLNAYELETRSLGGNSEEIKLYTLKKYDNTSHTNDIIHCIKEKNGVIQW